MVEYTRDKILPEDLIQKTNLQQHNFMIDAINDIDGRQADIEDVTNVNIDDIAVLKTNVVTLSNEKLDKADINADLHFGDISVTRDGTAVIMSLDVLNPTTGIVTPISFTIPGATSAEAGTMDASSVAWIAGAEERISALEGLSDVKAVADLTDAPTQAELTTGWVAVAGKQPETGDILQDINNSKLWVFVGTDWVLYGTIITIPLATTATIGGVRDTSLTAPGNRWYVHVEADGRLALIGGDALTTLIDTTIPALQSGVNNAVKKTGDQVMGGVLTIEQVYPRILLKTPDEMANINFITNGDKLTGYLRHLGRETASSLIFIVSNPLTSVYAEMRIDVNSDGDKWVTLPMRSSPGLVDAVNKGYLDSRLTSKQDNLTFDSAPVSGSNNPVKSGGVYNALAGKQDNLTFDNVPVSGSNNPVKSGGVYDALATKATVGETINADFTYVPAITSNAWLQCTNPNVMNFVTALVNHQNLTVEISGDGGTNSSFVCKNVDTAQADGSTSCSFLVPKNWYYRVVFISGKTCNIVEQPLML